MLNQIDEEGYNFENYRPVYLNSLYINVYTVFENALYYLGEKYCEADAPPNGKNYVKHYYDAITKKISNNSNEIDELINLITDVYRKLRNDLVRNRYLCKPQNVMIFKSLSGVSLKIDEYSNKERYRIEIKNKEFLVDFIEKIRYLVKGVYVSFYNSKLSSII